MTINVSSRYRSLMTVTIPKKWDPIISGQHLSWLNLRLEKELRFVSTTETKQQAALAPLKLTFLAIVVYLSGLSSVVSRAHIFVCLYQATLLYFVVWRIVKRVVYHDHRLLGPTKEIKQSFSKLSQLVVLTIKTPALINKFKTVCETDVAKRRTSFDLDSLLK